MAAVWPRLRTPAGVAIIAVLFWKAGSDGFTTALHRVDAPALLAALGIGLFTTVLSAWRWCVVARGLGLRLALPAAVADYYQALLLNAVLPTGVLGDVGRGVGHGRESGAVGRGVRAVALERLAGQIVLIGIGLAVLLSWPGVLIAAAGVLRAKGAAALAGAGQVVSHAISQAGSGSYGTLVAGIAVPCLLIGAVAVVPPARMRMRMRRDHRNDAGAHEPGRSQDGAGGREPRLRRVAATVVTEARQGLLTRDTLPGVLLLSVGSLAGNIVLFMVAARAAGSAAPVGRLLPLAVLALLVMGLPLNVGGWGPREAVSALAFGASGLGATQGLTVSVVYGLLALVAALPGAVVLLVRRAGRPQVPTPAAPAPAAPAPAAPAPAAPTPAVRTGTRRTTTRARRAPALPSPPTPAMAAPPLPSLYMPQGQG